MSIRKMISLHPDTAGHLNEPLALAEGETLRHAVRVLFVPRRVTVDMVAPYYAEWAEGEKVSN